MMRRYYAIYALFASVLSLLRYRYAAREYIAANQRYCVSAAADDVIATL